MHAKASCTGATTQQDRGDRHLRQAMNEYSKFSIKLGAIRVGQTAKVLKIRSSFGPVCGIYNGAQMGNDRQTEPELKRCGPTKVRDRCINASVTCDPRQNKVSGIGVERETDAKATRCHDSARPGRSASPASHEYSKFSIKLGAIFVVQPAAPHNMKKSRAGPWSLQSHESVMTHDAPLDLEDTPSAIGWSAQMSH